jgi:hypothetical protein
MQFAEAKKEAYETAIDSLSRYKFMMFGYWSAIWVHLNQLDPNKEPNPFRSLVDTARRQQQLDQGQTDMFPLEAPHA